MISCCLTNLIFLINCPLHVTYWPLVIFSNLLTSPHKVTSHYHIAHQQQCKQKWNQNMFILELFGTYVLTWYTGQVISKINLLCTHRGVIWKYMGYSGKNNTELNWCLSQYNFFVNNLIYNFLIILVNDLLLVLQGSSWAMHWWLLAHTQALEPHTESTGLSVCSCLNHKIVCLIDIHVAIKQVKINIDHAVNDNSLWFFISK